MRSPLPILAFIFISLGTLLVHAGPQHAESRFDIIHQLAVAVGYPNAETTSDAYFKPDSLYFVKLFRENSKGVDAFIRRFDGSVKSTWDQISLFQFAYYAETHSAGDLKSNPNLRQLVDLLAHSQLTEDAQRAVIAGINYDHQSEAAVYIMEHQKIVYSKIKEYAWSKLQRPGNSYGSDKYAETPLAQRLAKVLVSSTNESERVVEKLATRTHPVLPEETGALQDSVRAIVEAVKKNPTAENLSLLQRLEKVIGGLHESLKEAAESAARESKAAK